MHFPEKVNPPIEVRIGHFCLKKTSTEAIGFIITSIENVKKKTLICLSIYQNLRDSGLVVFYRWQPTVVPSVCDNKIYYYNFTKKLNFY